MAVEIRVERHLFNPFHSKTTGQFAPGHGGGAAEPGTFSPGNRPNVGMRQSDVLMTRHVVVRDENGRTFHAKMLDRDIPGGEERYQGIAKDAHPKPVIRSLMKVGFDGAVKGTAITDIRPGLTPV